MNGNAKTVLPMWLLVGLSVFALAVAGGGAFLFQRSRHQAASDLAVKAAVLDLQAETCNNMADVVDRESRQQGIDISSSDIRSKGAEFAAEARLIRDKIGNSKASLGDYSTPRLNEFEKWKTSMRHIVLGEWARLPIYTTNSEIREFGADKVRARIESKLAIEVTKAISSIASIEREVMAVK